MGWGDSAETEVGSVPGGSGSSAGRQMCTGWGQGGILSNRAVGARPRAEEEQLTSRIKGRLLGRGGS